MRRASGAAQHVGRLRSPAATRRALIFSALKPNAFATVTDHESGTTVRGRVAAVTTPAGMTIYSEAYRDSATWHTGRQLAQESAGKSVGIGAATARRAVLTQDSSQTTGAVDVIERDVIGAASGQQDAAIEHDRIRARHLPRLLQPSQRPRPQRVRHEYSGQALHSERDASPFGTLDAVTHERLRALPLPDLGHAAQVCPKI
jgi:hypothetical protein